MPNEEFIIEVYCVVDEFLAEVLVGQRLRRCGESPQLDDAEVLTMEIVGEYWGHNSDKGIWRYFKEHWQAWFPTLGCRTSFTRQCANLLQMKNRLRERIAAHLCPAAEIQLFDGFPIPTCHIKRCWSQNPFKGIGSISYCAAKDERYFGFKGHLLIHPNGMITGFTLATANIDERDILPEVVADKKGLVIADKGLIRPALNSLLAAQGINLQTPLRSNMKETRAPLFIRTITAMRRSVETVIGQLVERFRIQTIKAKDLWHLAAKVARKLLAHTVCFFINKRHNPFTPLQIELLCP